MGMEDGQVTMQRVWVDAGGPETLALAAHAEIHRAAVMIERARDINAPEGPETGPASSRPEREQVDG